MERRAVPQKLSEQRGVPTLVRSFPVAVAFPGYRRKPSPKSGGIQQMMPPETTVFMGGAGRAATAS